MVDANVNPSQEDDESKLDEGADDAPVTREEFKNMQKGIENLASKMNSDGDGTEKEGEEKEKKESPKPKVDNYNPVVKRLYTKSTPEIEEVWDEVVEEANALGQDPIEYYEGKKGWQLEAKARLRTKNEKEKTKDKLEEPSGKITKDSKINFDKITPEQISNLDSGAREEYRKYLRKADSGITLIRRS